MSFSAGRRSHKSASRLRSLSRSGDGSRASWTPARTARANAPCSWGALEFEAVAGGLLSELGYAADSKTAPGPSALLARASYDARLAAWNAAIYVNQIEEERLDEVVSTGAYLEATQSVLQKHGGLWFNDEAFVVTRRQK